MDTENGQDLTMASQADRESLHETLSILLTHGGVRLLESGRDAVEGRFDARELQDPDS
ncbi:hypothetical protein [Nocardia rhamnosiphila]